MTNNDLVIGETYVERLDRDRQQQDHERELVLIREKNETKRSRHEMLMYIGGFLAAAGVLVSLGLVWWTDLGENPATQPEVSDAQVEQQREEGCIDTGGGWIPKNTFSGSYPDSGMCVYPGHKVEETD